MRCHFDSWCKSGSIAGSLGSMYSYPSCTIRPASAVICTTEPLMPIQCPLNIRSTSIQAITCNENSQPYSTLCMLSLNLHYNKPPGKHTIQLSDILHYLWAGGHLRHSVCSICQVQPMGNQGSTLCLNVPSHLWYYLRQGTSFLCLFLSFANSLLPLVSLPFEV